MVTEYGLWRKLGTILFFFFFYKLIGKAWSFVLAVHNVLCDSVIFIYFVRNNIQENNTCFSSV